MCAKAVGVLKAIYACYEPRPSGRGFRYKAVYAEPRSLTVAARSHTHGSHRPHTDQVRLASTPATAAVVARSSIRLTPRWPFPSRSTLGVTLTYGRSRRVAVSHRGRQRHGQRTRKPSWRPPDPGGCRSGPARTRTTHDAGRHYGPKRRVCARRSAIWCRGDRCKHFRGVV